MHARDSQVCASAAAWALPSQSNVDPRDRALTGAGKRTAQARVVVLNSSLCDYPFAMFFAATASSARWRGGTGSDIRRSWILLTREALTRKTSAKGNAS